MTPKKAQVQLTFNWIYILIAGVVILLFFVGIIIKQKAIAEEDLQEDVLKIIESILIGAEVSEQTKNFIDISGLKDYTLEFKCEDDLSTFGLKGGSNPIELPLSPVFAPQELKTSGLILWSLPYKLPYKVMDLLMVTSTNTYYPVLGDHQNFRSELEKEVKPKIGNKVQFNFDFEINSLAEASPGRNHHIRVVDLGGQLTENSPLPSSLAELEDPQVSAVSFSGHQVTYYQKQGSQWKMIDQPFQLISLGGERDAAKYAAIFAADPASYQCNMMKVFRRLEYVNKVYAGKLEDILTYYHNFDDEDCLLLLERQPRNNLELTFKLFQSQASACSEDYLYCRELLQPASQLKDLNYQLKIDCLPLY